MEIQNVSPLHTLRLSFESRRKQQSRVGLFIYGLIVIFILGFARMQLDGWLQSFTFTFSVVMGFMLLYGMSLLLVKMVKRYFPYSWNYLWRQGLSNLYRQIG